MCKLFGHQQQKLFTDEVKLIYLFIQNFHVIFQESNYPNPFNPVTNLEFGISNLGFVTLKVYDVLGKEVATLVNDIRQPGNYTIEFDGSDLSSGIYFYKIEAGSFVQTKRMILLK